MKKGSSWLTAIRRAFTSSTTHHDEHRQKEERNRDKKRWKFRKSTAQDQQEQQKQVKIIKAEVTAEQRHAIALAVATAATAEAAMTTAQAAAEVVRLTRPMNPSFIKEHRAAVAIQTAFRGYLARRALRALKGLVKLQALVRGHSVRKRANKTLRCMQTLLRVQAKAREGRMRVSQDSAGCGTKSSLSCDTSLWDSRYVQEIAERRSMLSSFMDDLDDRPCTIQEIETLLQSRKDAEITRERVVSSAFAHQTRRTDKNPYQLLDEEEGMEFAELEQELPRWPDRWMASRSSFENRPRSRARASTSSHRDSIKTLKIDTGQPSINRKQYRQSTPSPSRAKEIQVRSGSPRCIREDASSITSNTSSLTAYYNYSGNGVTRHQQTTMPNYMAATMSVRARVRSQSVPRHRPGTPERDRTGPVKKRLSFPIPNSYYNQSLKSPSVKSTVGRVDHMSNVSSSCGGEASPSSTTDLRRWLR